MKYSRFGISLVKESLLALKDTQVMSGPWTFLPTGTSLSVFRLIVLSVFGGCVMAPPSSSQQDAIQIGQVQSEWSLCRSFGF